MGYQSNVGMRGLWRFEGQMLRNRIAGLTNPRILINPKCPKCHHHRNSVGHAAFILHLELERCPTANRLALAHSSAVVSSFSENEPAYRARSTRASAHKTPAISPPHPLNPSIFTPRDLLISSCIKLGELPLSRSINLNHLSPQL